MDDIVISAKGDSRALDQELSEEDLEAVVGGLARLWNDPVHDSNETED